MYVNFKWFYCGINTKAHKGEEVVGLSIGRLYCGWYRQEGFAYGILNEHDAL